MSEGDRLQVLSIGLGLDRSVGDQLPCHSFCDAVLGLGRAEIFLSLLQAQTDNLLKRL